MDLKDEKHLLADLRAQQQARFAMMLDVGLRALSARVLTFVALLLDAGLFAWAMAVGGWDRLATAAIFAAMSWCLVHLRPRKGAQHEE